MTGSTGPGPDTAPPWRLDALEPSTTLVTVNNRLAQELRRRHDSAQSDAGRTVWESADIIPWAAWLGRQYAGLLDAGFTALDLLSPVQERLLWQEIIEVDGAANELLRPAAAAEAARAAYALVHAWRLDEGVLGARGADETQRFLSWRRAFDRALARRGLLSGAQLPALVTAAVEAGVLELPARLVHSGFDDLAPAQTALFAALERAGCEVFAHAEPATGGRRRRIVLADAESEIRCAAAWAADQVRSNPHVRIGIVAPQVARQRRDLERLFGAACAPERHLGLAARPAPFDISIGEPLADQPLVAHGLLALDLLFGEQPLAAIGQLLRSPFIGGHATEWEARALFDVFLREDGLPRLGLDRLLRRLAAVDPNHPAHCAGLAERLGGFDRLRRGLPAQAAPDRWAAALQQALSALGWPGDRALDSVEFQQHRRLQDLLSELAALAKVRPRMRLGEAVGQLRSLAAETLFQAESPAVPIRILGPLEAAGLHFDALWLLGMHDQNWPPPAQPDPLLPVGLQRELGMPHASATRELAFATALTGRLAGGAAEVIASHARFDGEREQRPSPLMQDWEPLVADDLDIAVFDLVAACAAGARREAMPHPAAGSAAGRQRGGAGLLAAQARCPFQAVARHRLQAHALPEPSHAADAALLGDLVHAVLQRTWAALRDSATLREADTTALGQQVAGFAGEALEDLGRRRPDLFGDTFRALERDRLTALVLAWLDLERTRPGDFRVEALEQRQPVELAGLALSTRIDRIDRLADGSLVVIDYKTGREVSSAGWLDERLSEPQLPLYCSHAGDGVAAAVLARVRRDGKGCAFVGLGREPGILPGVQDPAGDGEGPDWDTLNARWRERLGALAREVLAGRADPTPSPQACRHCDLGALCRVQDILAGESTDV